MSASQTEKDAFDITFQLLRLSLDKTTALDRLSYSRRIEAPRITNSNLSTVWK